MKATDLMIGDWVCYDGDTEYNYPVKIEGMDISCDFCVTSDRDDTGFNGVIPIPLTPEILEKNGFNPTLLNGEDVPIAKVYPLKSIVGGYRFENFYPISIHICMNLKFVHELQHTLRLCGLDGLADNFKI